MRPLLVLLLAALACSDTTSPDFGLNVDASLSANTIRVGESVIVTVSVTNTSVKTARVTTGCPGPFLVLDTTGDLVIPPSPPCGLALMEVAEIPPGESHTYSIKWDASNFGAFLPPGTYRIQGSVYHVDGPQVKGNSEELRILQ